jgi:hypothetical protein
MPRDPTGVLPEGPVKVCIVPLGRRPQASAGPRRRRGRGQHHRQQERPVGTVVFQAPTQGDADFFADAYEGG